MLTKHVQQVTAALGEAGFVWKKESLEVMVVNARERLWHYEIDTVLGRFKIPRVVRMNVLGTVVPDNGGTLGAREDRRAAADRAFWAKRTCSQTPLPRATSGSWPSTGT